MPQFLLPNTLEMHWANLDNMSILLAFENAITTASGHTGNVQELCTVDHMIV